MHLSACPDSSLIEGTWKPKAESGQVMDGTHTSSSSQVQSFQWPGVETLAGRTPLPVSRGFDDGYGAFTFLRNYDAETIPAQEPHSFTEWLPTRVSCPNSALQPASVEMWPVLRHHPAEVRTEMYTEQALETDLSRHITHRHKLNEHCGESDVSMSLPGTWDHIKVGCMNCLVKICLYIGSQSVIDNEQTQLFAMEI